MRLKALREKRGISQLKLAMDLGLNQNSISRYESGAREADYKTLIALGLAYISAMPKQSIIVARDLTDLVQQVREIILSARAVAARSVDTVQVAMNFTVGQRIVEHEQRGDKRAAYGKQVMEHLAQSMTAEFGRGFSKRNLELMRQFYIMYAPRLKNFPSDLMPFPQIAQIVSAQSIQENSGKIAQTLSAQLPGFPLISWSHYVFLMSIANPEERMFYEIEAASMIRVFTLGMSMPVSMMVVHTST